MEITQSAEDGEHEDGDADKDEDEYSSDESEIPFVNRRNSGQYSFAKNSTRRTKSDDYVDAYAQLEVG